MVSVLVQRVLHYLYAYNDNIYYICFSELLLMLQCFRAGQLPHWLSGLPHE